MKQALRERNARRFARRFWEWLKHYWPWLAICLVSIVLVGRGQLQSEQISEQAGQLQHGQAQIRELTLINHNLVNSLQAAIVESCEVNGNTRAKVEREQLNEEIREAEHPNPEAFHALVAVGVSPEAIRKSEQRALVKYKRRLARVHVVNCQEQYRISPGSGARRRDSSIP